MQCKSLYMYIYLSYGKLDNVTTFCTSYGSLSLSMYIYETFNYTNVNPRVTNWMQCSVNCIMTTPVAP